jgi:hypothetical protein
MFVNVAQTTQQAVDRRSSTAEAQNMFDVLTTDIRAATNIPTSSTSTTWAVLAASSTSLTIITYTDAGPTFGAPYQVQFSIDGSGRLMLQQWNPPTSGTVTFPRSGSPSVVRYVGEGAQSTAIFSYSDKNGFSVTPGPSTLANIAAVTVNLTVQAPRSTVPVNIANTIWMPNAGLSTAYAGAN